ncbi:sensor histidine kinase [Halobacillus kuroshimensis]|uniref:Sensor histidine kinase n=1 Tax=Halobacillus kuroshimensis TaxID=302481 RepID=A0ABS3DXS3_9BACI|nr:sensor histidine kinase [Halobacillus kuroshimensis]MBN8236165.1 sensor histidine kinase [Halobacillus kuroshimensis]
MNLWQRQIWSGLFTFLLFAVLLTAVTFAAFPVEQWSVLWTREVLDLPYGFLILLLSLFMGLVTGTAQGWYWRRQLTHIEQQLGEVVKGSPLETDTADLAEVKRIEDRMKQLEDKIVKQAELSQRMVTERAEEREKSLQEVVIQERNRLARELHDSVSQQLFAASMMMSAINETKDHGREGEDRQLKMVERMIHQSQLEMRALLLHLRPVPLKDKTLAEGMTELLQELIQKVPLQIDWTIETFPLEKGVEDQLFRILQESVSNTLRHAKASTLSVMLLDRDQTVILKVIDDGMGFHVEEKKTSSYGLQNMEERAFEVGGVLKIVSVKGQGTRLEVKVPHRLKGGQS